MKFNSIWRILKTLEKRKSRPGIKEDFEETNLYSRSETLNLKRIGN